jgi:hypothetical protein
MALHANNREIRRLLVLYRPEARSHGPMTRPYSQSTEILDISSLKAALPPEIYGLNHYSQRVSLRGIKMETKEPRTYEESP